MSKPVTVADVTRLYLDYLYSNPEKVARMFMETGDVGILREARRRGMNLGPALAAEFIRTNRMWTKLK